MNSALYNHIDPRARRQRHADPRHRDGRPRVGRAQGPRARASTCRATTRCSAVSSTGSRTSRARGWTFEAADASFELLLRDELAGERLRHFTVESWRTIVEQRADGRVVSEATVKVHAGGERIIATGEGNGPVNALDNALRAGLSAASPSSPALELVDYKVRILEGVTGTDAVTRVLVETTDGSDEWTTIGRARERHRGVVDGARGRDHLRPAQGRARGGGLARDGLGSAGAHREVCRSRRRGRVRRGRRGLSRRRPRPRHDRDAHLRAPVRAVRGRRPAGRVRRRAAARPGAAQQDHRARQELRRARRGDGRRGPGRADDLPQAVDLGDRSRRPHRPAAAVGAGRARGRARRRDRPALPRRPGRAGARGRARLHRAPTTSPRATCSAATASGPGPRASTPSARSARGSRPRLDPADLAISCRVNGEVRQDGRTSLLVRGVAELVAWVST